MQNPGRSAGIILITIGILLLIGGFLAYIWGVPVTTGGFFSYTYMTYPFRDMGILLIVMGFVAMIIGSIIFALQNYLKRSDALEKIKVRCRRCRFLNDETATNCGYCGDAI